MLKTNASIRRFIRYQQEAHPDAPVNLFNRYEIYVSCVASSEYPKNFKEWVTS